MGLASGGDVARAVDSLADMTPKAFLALCEAVQMETMLNDVAILGGNRNDAETKMIERLESASKTRDKVPSGQSPVVRSFIVQDLARIRAEGLQ